MVNGGQFGNIEVYIKKGVRMLLYHLQVGQSGTITKNRNPQLITKGFTINTKITVDSKNGEDFVIRIGNHKYPVTAAQSKLISVC